MTNRQRGTCERTLDLSGYYTAEDVKKAYRKKSMLCHPDKGGSDEAFNKLTTCRDWLIDNLPSVESAHINWEYVSIECKLDWLLEKNPSPLEVKHTTSDPCKRCFGTGSLDKRNDAEMCPSCGGRGRKVGYVTQSHVRSLKSHACPDCYGRGKVFINACPECKGRGYEQTIFDQRFELRPLTIPEDTVLGNKVKVAVEVPDTGTDCYRKDLDLYVKKDVSVLDIVAGCDFEWKDLLSGTKVKINYRGFQKGKLRVRNRGLSRAGLRGHLIFVPEINFNGIEDLPEDLLIELRQARSCDVDRQRKAGPEVESLFTRL